MLMCAQEDGRDSMYEMEPELSSLAHSLDQLDDHVSITSIKQCKSECKMFPQSASIIHII